MCCRYLWLSLDRSCRAGELLLGTVEPFQIVLVREVICLRTSRARVSPVRSGEVVGMPVGTPDVDQWMTDLEWSFDPLSVDALSAE